VIVLPRDATPIDFAYAIHSDVGATCVGAKVNGRIVTLRYTLKNGDIVEIMTQPNHLPSKDWLSIVKTSRARNKIKHVINATERVKAIEIGEKYLEKEARRLGVQLGKVTRAEFERVAGEYGYSKIEDLYAGLGYGKFSARQVLQNAAPAQFPAEPEEAEKQPASPPQPVSPRRPAAPGDLAVKVKGSDDVMVYRAKCCNPIPGEAIVGYVTRGKGVAVHSLACPNVQNLMYEVERKIEVEWARSASDQFAVKLVVRTDDRPGLLNQLTSILSTENTNIRSLEARTDAESSDGAIIEMTVDVRDKKQLEKIVVAMRRISGVRDVERLLS
jgi:GTP pyrophosphokinase